MSLVSYCSSLCPIHWSQIKLHHWRHCLHMRNLNSDFDHFLIFRCKLSQHAGCRGHVNMACNQWLKTWDVAITYTAGSKIRVANQWIIVDHMTFFPTKIKSNLNCRCQLLCDEWANLKHKAEVLPVYIRCTTFKLIMTVFHNEDLNKWVMMFGF